MPDWAKPLVGYAVGTDWPRGDEDGCFRLADACATTAQEVLYERGMAVFTRQGDDWDGDAMKEFVKRVQRESDPLLAELIEQLVSAALHYNDLGVQVQYTKRMIEVSVWFLIFQIIWLLAAAAGPLGPAAAAMVGARVQLTRLAIAQLGKRLLINIGLFGGLMGTMDLAVQASQSRRDHLDWEQIMMSAGSGAVLGGFLTAFTGIVPARSIFGLMARSGVASGATDVTMQVSSGQPLDWDRLFKSFTSGVLGGADAHWASWSPFAHDRSSAGPAGDHVTSLTFFGTDPHITDHGSASSSSHSSSSSVSSPSSSQAADGPMLASAKPAGLGPDSLAGQSSGPFRILENPGKSGDGFVSSGLWGKYGAAGVLIKGIDEHGQPRYLLMQQSQDVSNAGKWQLPGGALDSLESPLHGAARELSEELGVNQTYLNTLKLKGEHAVEIGDGGWKYTNLVAEGPMFTPKVDTFEVSGAKWFTLKELSSMANNGQLHPALAKALPDVLALYHKDASADLAATSATPSKDYYTGSGTARRLNPPVDFGARAVSGGDVPTPWQTPHGKPATSPPAYSGLTSDGPSSSLGQTIHRTESGLYYTAAAPHVPLDAPFGARLVAPTYGNAIWTEVFNDMSRPEREAAERYAGNGYAEMNGYLRKGDSALYGNGSPQGAKIKKRVIAQIEALKAVLRRQPVPETIDVFRRLRLTSNLFTVPIHELPGTVQRDPGFFSTNLGDEPTFYGEVTLRLRVAEGTPAFYLDLISHWGENELLLGCDVSWFAEDVRRQDGQWFVYGWVLPEESGG